MDCVTSPRPAPPSPPAAPPDPGPVPGDVLDLTTGEAVHGGWCVARQGQEETGRVVFVRHALPGERVLAVVTQATSRFCRADAVQVLAASPDRVPPPCPHARPGGCGGCDWQHASLPAQRALKAQVIRQQLARLAGLDREVTVEELPGHPDGLGWRTTVGFAIGQDGAAGLRRHRSHEVVEVGSCPIAHPLVAATGVTRQRWPGASRADVAVVPGSGERAVVITGPAASREPAGRLSADSVLLARPGRDRPAVLAGRGPVTRQAAGREWRVSAGTFWQGHPAAAGVLAAAVLDALRPEPGDVALDLYCGAGLFAGVLAGAVGPSGRVIAIEASAGAVRDARRNLRGTPWARVHRGDVAAVLGSHGQSGAGLAAADPPRTGLSRPVVDALAGQPASAALRRIAYVSCDPATLARDIALLRTGGWELAELRAFDAFPMTHHVECLAALARD